MGYLVGESASGTILEDLLGSFPDFSNMSTIQVFGFVVLNNSFKGLLFMLGGVLAGLPSLFFIVFNGFFIGWLSYIVGSERGLIFVLAALLPHGIIETPAIILSMTMGVSIGYEFINRIRGGGNLRREISLAIGLYIRRIIPLLVLAAVIEVTVTPLIISLLG
jgi:stage II sporulation protein M